MGKRLVIVLFTMSLVALWGTEALAARVCVFKSLACAGGCCAWSGSVEVSISADQLGSVTQSPKWLVADIFVDAGLPPDGGGKAVCENSGGNESPGIQVVDVAGPTTLHTQIQVTKNMIQGGNVVVNLFADPDPAFLAAVDPSCPNPKNWDVIDFAPCAMTASFQVREGSPTGTLLAEAIYDCTLDSCDTLQWDTDLQGFERRQYTCTQIQ
jgi:hypothetical protein